MSGKTSKPQSPTHDIKIAWWNISNQSAAICVFMIVKVLEGYKNKVKLFM